MPWEVEAYTIPTGRYVAHIVDDEGEGPKGEGRTKIAALVELAEGVCDAKGGCDRLVDVLVAILDAEMIEARVDGRNASYLAGLDAAKRTIMGVL